PIGGRSSQAGKMSALPIRGCFLAIVYSRWQMFDSNSSHSSRQTVEGEMAVRKLGLQRDKLHTFLDAGGVSDQSSHRGTTQKHREEIAYRMHCSETSCDVAITLKAAVNFCSIIRCQYSLRT